MTVLDVDPRAYIDAGNRCTQAAADLYGEYSALSAVLRNCDSMAGSYSEARSWASSYDAQARETLAALDDAIRGLEKYGDVLRRMGHNHELADATANIDVPAAPATPHGPPVLTGCTPSSPPSAGGSGKGLIDAGADLASKVGIPIPDGDTHKLATATTGWRSLAAGPARAAFDDLSSIAAIFSAVESPDVEFIVEDLHEIRSAGQVILDQANEISRACDEHREGLEERRLKLEGILRDLAVELAVDAAIAIAASCITFGLGAIAASASAARTVRNSTRIIRAAVDLFKTARRISSGVPVRGIERARSMLKRFRHLGDRSVGTKVPRPTLGAGVRTIDPPALTTSRGQIEKKFLHAGDFGISTGRSKDGFEAFEKAVHEHVRDSSTLHIDGTYRGNPAILNYNPASGLVVVQSKTGAFISGWRVTPLQENYILTEVKFGGG